ncbi:MAG: phenylalanine--tRNA ligase subunit beta, partial [Candidatus Omnitrophica bacterium]|nr:phenylalanine--tRNA ligase subunit beta [Candidatus Omnitrophota bacterium]
FKLPVFTGRKNHPPSSIEHRPVSIRVENKKDCPLYTARVMREVVVAGSPDWIKRRLELIGCRSVNNIVDITNYILFTYGQPLHAFDLDKLQDNTIIVRRARDKERITTIDKENKELSEDILVIADKEKPVAIAGIMGGLDSEVNQKTRNIILEAAVFNPVRVRFARQKLGMQSESAYRFERQVDPGSTEFASAQAQRLILELAGGRSCEYRGCGISVKKHRAIILKSLDLKKALGVSIPRPKIKKILEDLGFKVQLKNGFTVTPATFRADVAVWQDLLEEVARIYGYEKIPVSVPMMHPRVSINHRRESIALIKNILVGLGSNEVITYSLIDRSWLKDYGPDIPSAIEILNPLSQEQDVLRPTLIPSLLRCVAVNLNQKQDYVNIFEITNLYLDKSEALPSEEPVLGIAVCGVKRRLFAQGALKDEAGLRHLKGVLETLLYRLGIPGYHFSAVKHGADLYLDKEKTGRLLRIDKPILENMGIKNKDVFAAELFLSPLLGKVNLKKTFLPLPIYPGIVRDISFIVRENEEVGELLKAIKEKGAPLIQKAEIVDYYKGRQVPEGCLSLTVSCFYRSDERTLTESEITPLHSEICRILSEKFSCQIREMLTC